MTSPLRLRLDTTALVANWRTLAAMSGSAACGAAIKADGYGLGALEVATRLAQAGCRDFFVATWAEAQALAPLGLAVSVLHGVRAEDMALALQGFARPVLNTALQIARWREGGGGACDVMVDTGINRLGIAPGTDLLDGLQLDTLMSHLACGDDDSDMNTSQRDSFAALAGETQARRMSLANSAGIALCVRPHPARTGALWRHPASGNGGPDCVGGNSPGADPPAPSRGSGRKRWV